MRQRRRLAVALSLCTALGLTAAACGSDNSQLVRRCHHHGRQGRHHGRRCDHHGGRRRHDRRGQRRRHHRGRRRHRDVQGRHRHRPADPDGHGRRQGQDVGLLFDVTGRGDKSFNDAAAAGLDKAKADFGITGHESTPTAADGSDRPERIKAFVGKNDLIVAVGFLWGDAMTASATANPNQQFAIIDAIVPSTTASKPLPNVRSMMFAAEQGSFLVGAAAACASKTGKIGFIGGVENDLIKKFEAGFTAGVKQVNPNATVDVKYITPAARLHRASTTRPRARPSPRPMYDSGIDVVYAAAGGSGKGLFQAAERDRQEAGRGLRHRRRLRPVPDGLAPTRALHPHVGAEAGRRGHVRGHRRRAERQAHRRDQELRPQEQRRRLRRSATRTSTSTPAPSRT